MPHVCLKKRQCSYWYEFSEELDGDETIMSISIDDPESHIDSLERIFNSKYAVKGFEGVYDGSYYHDAMIMSFCEYFIRVHKVQDPDSY